MPVTTKKSIRDVDVSEKRVLVRVDFNVPMGPDGTITDDRRIRESLPTLRYLVNHGAKVILMSHLGRPDGKVVPKYSLRPVAERLSQLLGQPVQFAPSTIGPEAEQAVRSLQPGGALLLENVRFYPGEEANDPSFTQELAKLGDIFVNDAFGTAHRAHASTVGIARFLPAVAGFLMEKELRALGGALESPKHPLVAIVGGAKVSSKIGVLRNLQPKVDRLLVGGGMANTFLKAKGYHVGRSLVEDDKLDVARDILRPAGDKLVLPVDAVIAQKAEPGAETRVVAVDAVPQDWMILDVGPKTVDEYAQIAGSAGTVIWNGPLGLFEIPEFSEGTRRLGEALAKAPAQVVVGGGDLVAALEQFDLTDRLEHVSTGGGASLEFLEGKELPGVAALEDK